MRGIFLTLLCVAAGMTIGLMITQPDTSIVEARAQAAVESSQRDRLLAAFEGIRANHVDELDQSDLVDAAIKAMIGKLDPHSVYLDEKTFREMRITMRGVAGIGIEVVMENGLLKVIAPIDETQAAKAGLRANDIITHVDHMSIQGLILDQVVAKIRGPVNTNVRLTIMRKGLEQPIELTVTRDFLHARSVRVRLEGDDIGYIRIAYFGRQTTQMLRSAVSELASQIPAQRLNGYVLDLRNNPGGMLDEAVSVADAFLDDGEIVSVRGRNLEQAKRFNARPGDIIDGKPLVVLINGGTASGAEILAGALQNHKRATVIGSRSFGRGSVQSILPLGERHGALRLTTGRYFTPAGHSIDVTGIVPDIEGQNLLEDPARDQALRLAYDLLRGIAYNPAFPPSRVEPVPQ